MQGHISSLGNSGQAGTNDLDSVNDIVSWKDPHIFLKSSFTDVSIIYHDIVYFVQMHMSWTGMSGVKLLSDASWGGGGLVINSGPSKPKLESLKLCQWSKANLSIMFKFLSSGELPHDQILDYLSYTARILDLIFACEMVSVFYFFRQYRQLQLFRSGTDVPHLQSVYLRPKNLAKPQTSAPKPFVKHDIQYASHTSGGREICTRCNSRKGCFMSAFRFEHVCAVPGRAHKHPAHTLILPETL